MKTKQLLMSAMMLALAACATDPAELKPEGGNEGTTLSPAALTIIKSDNSRLLKQFSSPATRVATRGEGDIPAMQIPASNIPGDVASYDELTNEIKPGNFKTVGGKTYYLGNIESSLGSSEVNIYVTEKNVTMELSNINDNNSGLATINIIVAESGSLTIASNVKNVHVTSFGELNFASTWGVTLTNASIKSYSTQALDYNYNLKIGDGGSTKASFIWRGDVHVAKFEFSNGIYDAEIGGDFTVEQSMSSPTPDATFVCHGTATIKDQYGQNNEYYTESTFKGGSYTFNNVVWEKAVSFTVGGTVDVYGDATFKGYTTFENGGTYHFHGDAEFEDVKLWNQGVNLILDQCTKINGNLAIGGANPSSQIDIAYFLSVGTISAQDGAIADFNLNDALLNITGEYDGNANGGKNSLMGNIMINGTGNSGVRIQKSLMLYKKTGTEHIAPNFKGSLVILGVKEVAEDGTVTEHDPNLQMFVLQENNTIISYPDIEFQDNVKGPAKDGEAESFVIGSTTKEDCRAPYTYNENNENPTDDDVDGQWLTSPYGSHKYSATGIDFGPNGEIYVSWHSNLPGGENQTDEEGDEFWHNHGTNVGSNGSNPSLDSNNDWGGIIDVLTPAGDNYTLSVTAEQKEHKYNHVKYYNGNLYLATTSRAVKAALHIVPANFTNAEEGFRVNLTGNSANCVEVVGNELVTISGRASGGINWFSFADIEEATKKHNESDKTSDNKWTNGPRMNVEKKYINADTLNFGGKWVAYNAATKQVVTLNNTENGTVTFYDTNQSVVGTPIETGISLVPNDGKNVCITDANGNIYLCAGQNGFHVFDATGKRIGGSKKSANACAFDENDPDNGYVYIATGEGLAILDTKKTDNAGNYATVKHVHFRGTYFADRTQNDKTEEGVVKASSNYVRVKDGMAYVAYGMYGLRMYQVSDLTNAYEQAQ